MNDYVLLKNIKQTLHKTLRKKYYYKATNMEFTLKTLPTSQMSRITSILTIDPEQQNIFKTTDREHELNVLYLAYGVEEFDGDEELAKEYLKQDGFGESNAELLSEIRKVNPGLDTRIKDIIVTLAFSKHETQLLNAILDAHAQVELAKYLADTDNVLEAIDFCKELFMAIGTAHYVSKAEGISNEQAFLNLAKPILEERGLITKEEIQNTPPPDAVIGSVPSIQPRVNIVR